MDIEEAVKKEVESHPAEVRREEPKEAYPRWGTWLYRIASVVAMLIQRKKG